MSRNALFAIGALIAATALAISCAASSASSTRNVAPGVASLIPPCAADAPSLESAADSTEVDRKAIARPNRPSPKYPPDARERDIQGEVRVVFVVDTLGRPEMCTARIVRSAHPDLTRAVLEVLPQTRFFPAEQQGRKVRQRIETVWVFRVTNRFSLRFRGGHITNRTT